MALRNDNGSVSAPAFEAMEGDTSTLNNAQGDYQTTAVAPHTTPTAVAPKPITDGLALKSLQNAISASDLEALGIGTFPRITVGLDGFSVNKNEKELGKRIKVSVVSWNYVWIVTHGLANASSEDNKLIRNSYDGVNLKGGEGTVQDYVKYLKTEGYANACAKQYAEIYCNVIEYQDAKGNTVAVPDDEQQLYQVSLSPQSVQQWGRFMLESGLRKMKGITDSNLVVMNQEKKVLGANKFGLATFSTK